ATRRPYERVDGHNRSEYRVDPAFDAQPRASLPLQPAQCEVCLDERKATGCRPARRSTSTSWQQTGVAAVQYRCAPLCSNVRSRLNTGNAGECRLAPLERPAGQSLTSTQYCRIG